jgi:hypothetical protein
MNTIKLEITLPADLGDSLLDLYCNNPEIKTKCDALGISQIYVIKELGKAGQVYVMEEDKPKWIDFDDYMNEAKVSPEIKIKYIDAISSENWKKWYNL